MSRVPTETDDPYWRPARPQDCALLVAVPLTRDAFLADVALATADDPGTARGDYAFNMAYQGHKGDAEAAWQADGLAVAKLASDLIEDARDSGFRYVSEDTDGAAFRQCMGSGASTILIVAHRRGAEVFDWDIRPGLHDQLLEVLSEPAPPFALRLSQSLAGLDLADAKVVRRGLNAFIASEQEPDDDTRDVLDALLRGGLVPGSCVELRDGYYKDAELADRMPPDWKGVIELSVCHSVRLAVALKQARKDRHIITNEAQKQPSRCLREMREAVLRLAHKPQPYVPLRAHIFCEYSEMLRGKQADADKSGPSRARKQSGKGIRPW
jgi:hypothetical protein